MVPKTLVWHRVQPRALGGGAAGHWALSQAHPCTPVQGRTSAGLHPKAPQLPSGFSSVSMQLPAEDLGSGPPRSWECPAVPSNAAQTRTRSLLPIRPENQGCCPGKGQSPWQTRSLSHGGDHCGGSAWLSLQGGQVPFPAGTSGQAGPEAPSGGLPQVLRSIGGLPEGPGPCPLPPARGQMSSSAGPLCSLRRYHFSLSGRGRALTFASTGHGCR